MRRWKKQVYGPQRFWIRWGILAAAVVSGVLLYTFLGPQKTIYTGDEAAALRSSLYAQAGIDYAAYSEEDLYFIERSLYGYLPGLYELTVDDDREVQENDVRYYQLSAVLDLQRYQYLSQMYQRFAPVGSPSCRWPGNKAISTAAISLMTTSPYMDYSSESTHFYFRRSVVSHMNGLGYSDQRDYYHDLVQKQVMSTSSQLTAESLSLAGIAFVPGTAQADALCERITLDRDYLYQQLDLTAQQKLAVFSYCRICYIYQRAEEMGLVLPYSWQQAQDMTLGELEPALDDVAEQINADPSQEQRNRQYQSPYAHLGIWPSKMMNR